MTAQSGKEVLAIPAIWQLWQLLQFDLADRHVVAIHGPCDCDLDVIILGQVHEEFLSSFVAVVVKLDDLVVVRKYGITTLLAGGRS